MINTSGDYSNKYKKQKEKINIETKRETNIEIDWLICSLMTLQWGTCTSNTVSFNEKNLLKKKFTLYKDEWFIKCQVDIIKVYVAFITLRSKP